VFSVQETGGKSDRANLENRVGSEDTGSPGRPVSSGLQVPGELGLVVQEQDPLGDLFHSVFFQNVLQLHQQR